jgi:hypothetical protein
MSGETVHEGLVEHAAIDKAFRALLAAVDGAGSVAAAFLVVADLVRKHLGSEDLDIAGFADVDPEEARGLLLEHEGIRRTLDALGAELEGGALSSKAVHDLKLRFTMHEAREETGLYRWVAARAAGAPRG